MFGPYHSCLPDEETGPAQILRNASAVALEIVISLPSQRILVPTRRRASQWQSCGLSMMPSLTPSLVSQALITAALNASSSHVVGWTFSSLKTACDHSVATANRSQLIAGALARIPSKSVG